MGSATEAHVEEIPAPPEGWFELLVLEERRAIRLLTSEEPWRDAGGLFFAEEASLAVVEGSSLVAYGDGPALERVRKEVAQGRAVRLEELHVEAIRAGEHAMGRWAFRRPAFTYLVA